jgi:hypothetical protein
MTYGRQEGHLAPCTKSPHHGHYPVWEDCPYCPTPTADIGTMDTLPPPSMTGCIFCGAATVNPTDYVCPSCVLYHVAVP